MGEAISQVKIRVVSSFDLISKWLGSECIKFEMGGAVKREEI